MFLADSIQHMTKSVKGSPRVWGRALVAKRWRDSGAKVWDASPCEHSEKAELVVNVEKGRDVHKMTVIMAWAPGATDSQEAMTTVSKQPEMVGTSSRGAATLRPLTKASLPSPHTVLFTCQS